LMGFKHLSQNFSTMNVISRVAEHITHRNDSLVYIVCLKRQPRKAVQNARSVRRQSRNIDVQLAPSGSECYPP